MTSSLSPSRPHPIIPHHASFTVDFSPSNCIISLPNNRLANFTFHLLPFTPLHNHRISTSRSPLPINCTYASHQMLPQKPITHPTETTNSHHSNHNTHSTNHALSTSISTNIVPNQKDEENYIKSHSNKNSSNKMERSVLDVEMYVRMWSDLSVWNDYVGDKCVLNCVWWNGRVVVGW